MSVLRLLKKDIFVAIFGNPIASISATATLFNKLHPAEAKRLIFIHEQHLEGEAWRTVFSENAYLSQSDIDMVKQAHVDFYRRNWSL